MRSEQRKCCFPCLAAFGQFLSILGVSVARPRRHDCEQYCPSLIEACMVERYVYDKLKGKSPSVSRFSFARLLVKMGYTNPF